MPGFVAPDVITDPLVLQANAKQLLEEELPGWHSSPGSIEDLLIAAFSYSASEQAEALNAELVAAYRSLGALVGVEPIRAQPATGLATFTLTDNAGHTLLASGTIIGLRTASNELQTFRLVSDLVIAAGSNKGAGLVEATEAGEAGSNLGGEAELISADAVVLSVTVATTGGGVDEEEEQTFPDRLTEELAIQKPGPVLAKDAATIARNVPAVYRATAVDNLRPSAADGGEGAEASNIEKCVTVSCVDANGKPCSAEVRATVKALLQSLREANFQFFVVAPHYTKIDVAATVFAWPGENPAVVKAAVEEALRTALSPAQWGADSTGRAPRWANDPIVRQSELFTVVGNVPGVRWCSALTFAKHGTAMGTTNVTLGSGSAVPALPDVDGTNDGTGIPAAFTITVEPTT
jgi:uncharacterized phage protein gp47/JayE